MLSKGPLNGTWWSTHYTAVIYVDLNMVPSGTAALANVPV